jgi:hypothetical protein
MDGFNQRYQIAEGRIRQWNGIEKFIRSNVRKPGLPGAVDGTEPWLRENDPEGNWIVVGSELHPRALAKRKISFPDLML